MAQIYTIVKKNSVAHQSAKASLNVRNERIVAAGDKHVLIPALRSISFGHSVSHAKNRVSHRRMPNLKVMHVVIDGVNKAIRMASSDLRTYRKVTATPQAEK